ncbi:MAG TPA: acetylxylan esterase [Gemmataceae bacterium]|nr:acetylxylan esterase [Gemmataceae bacterium]
MRHLFATALAFLPAATWAADFPEVAQLTAQPILPNPLLFLSGKRVETREQWEKERRPELKRLFQHYMYGELPDFPVQIQATVEREDAKALHGKATLREVTIRVGPPEVPAIHLLLVIPNGQKGKVPVFVGMNFSGNHALLDDPAIRLPDAWLYPNHPGVVNNRATDAGRGKEVEVWAIDQTIDRGYAVATFYNGDVDPDTPYKREGMRPYLAEKGAKPATIAAWAWGIHRAVDYLLTVKEIDAHRIAVVGHSRLGKTALLAAAFDERIALAIPLQAGCGGTAPSRAKVGESVKQINDHFPHWFNDEFKKFNSQPEKLPFDQHCLVALCAPRPVLFANAVEDTWANPVGQYEVLKAADPVYRFLGVEGLAVEKLPEINKIVDSRLGYFIRPGKHSMTRADWKIFLDFADKNLK